MKTTYQHFFKPLVNIVFVKRTNSCVCWRCCETAIRPLLRVGREPCIGWHCCMLFLILLFLTNLEGQLKVENNQPAQPEPSSAIFYYRNQHDIQCTQFHWDKPPLTTMVDRDVILQVRSALKILCIFTWLSDR